jgi:endonuclease/exonuclease/phosphatase family metal-dependent hydrolase
MPRLLGVLIIILLGLTACTMPGGGPDGDTFAPVTAPSIRIVAWNPEFLWDGEAPEDGSSEVRFEWKGKPELAGPRIEAAAKIIGGLHADITVLSEIEGPHILDRLLTSPGLSDRDLKPVFVQGEDTFTGQDMGILAGMSPMLAYRSDDRVPVDSRSQGVSKNLVARFPFAVGRCLSVIAIHLLSRAEDASRAEARQAQAEVVRRTAVKERSAGCEVVVAGDFNDYDPDVADPAGHTAVTTVLKTIKSMEPTDPDDDLINPAIRLPLAERYSNRWDRDGDGRIELPREGSLIDHVLVSPTLQVLDIAIARPLVQQEPLSDHDPIAVTIAPSDDLALRFHGRGFAGHPASDDFMAAYRTALTVK